MDGARIHLDEHIVYFLRSVGIKVLFLPAYCPFYNPIEVLFGLIKRRSYDLYKPGVSEELLTMCNLFKEFSSYDLRDIFIKCGYTSTGHFDPICNLDWTTTNI